MKIFTILNYYNYLVPLYLFIHYILSEGSEVRLIMKELPKNSNWKLSPCYLSLGHFIYENHEDLYDFNEGEWPNWLINMGKPFKVTW